jgi:hypothetical protein
VTQQINLFNPIFLQQKKIFAARTMAQALGLLTLGLVLIAGTAWYSVNKLRRDLAEVSLQAAKNQARLAAAASEFAPRQPNAGLTTEAGDAEAQLASLRRVAQIIQNGDLGNTRGYAETFRALGRQHQDGLWLTAVSIGSGADMSLQGRALDATLVPAYMARLRREPVLQGTTFGNLQISQPPAAEPTPAAVPVQRAAPAPTALAPDLVALLPQLAGMLPQQAAAPAVPPAPATIVKPASAPLAFIEFSLQAKAVEAAREEARP